MPYDEHSLTQAIDMSFNFYVETHKTYPDCIFISTSAYDRLLAENARIVLNNGETYEESMLHYRNLLEGDDGLFMFGICVHRFVSHEQKWFFGAYGGMMI